MMNTVIKPIQLRQPSPLPARMLILAAGTLALLTAAAQELLYNFPGPPGTNSALVQGTDGNFYGTTSAGGISGYGTVYKMTPAGAVTALYSFAGATPASDGAVPYAGLVQGVNGNFYGTTFYGGDGNISAGGGKFGGGTVFSITPAGQETVVARFEGTNGSRPFGALIQGRDGNFYGTTYYGGDLSLENGNGRGTVFKVTPDGTLTMLTAFDGPTYGGHPCCQLVQGNDGKLYGTTYWGGVPLSSGNGYGTAFSITPDGTLTKLASFDGTHGGHPFGGLVQGNDGKFYGTTLWGGSSLNNGNGFGAAFSIVPGDTTVTMLLAFSGANGRFPLAGLSLGNDGLLYGTTSSGGNGYGTVFAITPAAGALTTLVAFTGDNGSALYAGLTLGSDTNLYGTTCRGGSAGAGTVFRLNVAAPLVITRQPADLAVPLGANASFQAAASGAAPITYQWRFNGVDRPNATNTVLTITNVQSSDGGGYSVAVSNFSGSVTSRVATLQAGGLPPSLIPAASFQTSAVDVSNDFSFAPVFTGDAPMSFQWQFNGQNLDGQTNSILAISTAQASDQGDYSVILSNAFGAVMSDSVRLWVTPAVSDFLGGNFTNFDGSRLPYFYVLPPNYDPNRTYPLLCWLHGSPGDETSMVTTNTVYSNGQPLAATSALKVFASLGRQQTDPGILLWVTRCAGDENWTTAYIQLVAAFLDQATTLFGVDTNRIYIGGGSEGVHAAWDIAAMRPGFFAGGRLMDGVTGSSPASSLATLPLWVFHSAADANVPVTASRQMVRYLRLAGGKPIYTEYNSGDHLTSIATAEQTPVAVDWLTAQRQGVASPQGPLISITNRFAGLTPTTAATSASLAGVANAAGQPISSVTWENAALGLSGQAQGSNSWSAAAVPLLSSQISLLLVTGTTVSWSPVLGGNTTFNDALSLLSSPIIANLSWQNGTAVLDWAGGAPPFQVQMTTNLADGYWQTLGTDVTPPLSLLPAGPAGFYRILGP